MRCVLCCTWQAHQRTLGSSAARLQGIAVPTSCLVHPPPPHPSAGAVFLFCKAHEQLGGSGSDGGAYLAAAERSGEAVWERGLLRKGPGSCHGVSGNAYAMLRLHRSTGQDRWLYRAWQLAQFMERGVEGGVGVGQWGWGWGGG